MSSIAQSEVAQRMPELVGRAIENGDVSAECDLRASPTDDEMAFLTLALMCIGWQAIAQRNHVSFRQVSRAHPHCDASVRRAIAQTIRETLMCRYAKAVIREVLQNSSPCQVITVLKEFMITPEIAARALADLIMGGIVYCVGDLYTLASSESMT